MTPRPLPPTHALQPLKCFALASRQIDAAFPEASRGFGIPPAMVCFERDLHTDIPMTEDR